MRARFITLGRWIACIAYVVLFAEVFLRLFSPVVVFPRYVTAAPYGVRVNEPNRTYWHSSPDVSLQIRTNSKGVRSDYEFSYLPATDVKRIVVLGDSFAMGYEATLEQMFTTQMQNALIAQGKKVEVINLSVSGHGNAEELIVLREEGLKYKPNLVLLCWHESDLSENIRSALYELTSDGLRTKNKSYLPGVAIQQRLSKIPGYEAISANSHLYSWIREALSTKVVKPLLLVWQQSQREDATPDDAAPAEEGNYANELTSALLKQISEETRSAGAAFLILDIPSQGGPDVLRSVLPKDVAESIDVVSPIPELTTQLGANVFHKKSHRHFTPAACKIVGETLAAEILKSNYLD